MGIPRVNLVVNPNPCLEKPALRVVRYSETKLMTIVPWTVKVLVCIRPRSNDVNVPQYLDHCYRRHLRERPRSWRLTPRPLAQGVRLWLGCSNLIECLALQTYLRAKIFNA